MPSCRVEQTAPTLPINNASLQVRPFAVCAARSGPLCCSKRFLIESMCVSAWTDVAPHGLLLGMVRTQRTPHNAGMWTQVISHNAGERPGLQKLSTHATNRCYVPTSATLTSRAPAIVPPMWTRAATVSWLTACSCAFPQKLS